MKPIHRALWFALLLPAATATVPQHAQSQYLNQIWTETFEYPDAAAHLVAMKTAHGDGSALALINLAESGGGRVYLLKINATGQITWGALVVGEQNRRAAGVLLSADSAGGAFVLTVDSTSGTPVWTLHRFGPSGTSLWDRAVDVTDPESMDCDASNRVGIWGTSQRFKFGLMVDATGNDICGASVTVEPEPGTTHTATMGTGEIVVLSTLRLFGHSDLQCNMYTLAGGQNWDVIVEGTGSNDVAYGRDLCLDTTGDVYILAQRGLPTTPSAEVIRLRRSDGSQLWARSITAGSGFVPDAIVYCHGHVHAVGRVGLDTVMVQTLSDAGVTYGAFTHAMPGIGRAPIAGISTNELPPLVLMTTWDGAHPSSRAAWAGFAPTETHTHDCIDRAVCRVQPYRVIVGNDVLAGSVPGTVEFVGVDEVPLSVPLEPARGATSGAFGATLRLTVDATDAAGLRVRIFDVQGREVEGSASVVVSAASGGCEVAIDGAALARGAYFVVMDLQGDPVGRYRWLLW